MTLSTRRILPVGFIGVSDYRKGVNTGTDLFQRADQAFINPRKEEETRLASLENDDQAIFPYPKAPRTSYQPN